MTTRAPRIPASTRRAHLPQSNPFCDQVAVLNMARLLGRPGKRYADMNLCAAKNDDVNLHWPDGPKRNGYRYLELTGGRRRPMTRAELHRPVILWRVEEIRRWRKTRHAGTGVIGHQRPGTVAERQAQARERGVVICWEAKSRDYRHRAIAARAVATVEASGWPAYFMTLVTMRYWGQKLTSLHLAGAQTALLAHGAPRPHDLDEYVPFIDRIWGRWRKPRRKP